MKPASSEYPVYYGKYIAMVETDDLLEGLKISGDKLLNVVSKITEEKGNFRYAENKWSVKELLQHIIDTERVFAYRALCFSRGEKKELPGFDENAYASNSNADQRRLSQIIDDFSISRNNTISLFRSFDESRLSQTGLSGTNTISVRALGFMVAGHGIHHINVLETRYLV